MEKIINWDQVKGYFRIMADKEDEKEIIDNVSKGITFHGANLWILIFAIFIASLGLNINSTAVIIGAMLISPLMGPIIGMGLAIGINDFDMLKRSFKNYFIAVLISVVTATLYFLISPFNEVQSELLSRTSPTLYDVLIAFCGGAAGIVAICTKGKGNVLPGVAIATALMPPLCTAGYGIATGHFFYFLGAAYLFFINTIFICLATYIGVRMLNFQYKKDIDINLYRKFRRYIIIIVALTMIPASVITFNIIKKSIFNTNMNNFIRNEFNQKGTQVVAHDIIEGTKTLRIAVIGKNITKKSLDEIKITMADYQLEDYHLQVIQGSQSDSLLLSNQFKDKVTNIQTNYTQIIQSQTEQINQLESSLDNYTKYEKLSRKLSPQLKVLFPEIQSLALQKTFQVNTDTTATNQYVTTMIRLYDKKHIKKEELVKFTKWIKTYLPSDSVKIMVSAR
jgi:uncharacterized hydrophobic protein (TIGR00271 family)